MEYSLITILLVPVHFTPKNYDYILAWEQDPEGQYQCALQDSVSVHINADATSRMYEPNSPDGRAQSLLGPVGGDVVASA